MATEVRAVYRHSLAIVNTISQWLRLRDGRVLPLRYTQADQLRLLQYRTWMLRYRMPVLDLLDIVVPVLREQVAKRAVRKRGKGIGVSVGALTGAGAEKIIQDYIRKQFPDNEHITIWRERERDKQIAVEQQEANGDMPVAPERQLRILDFDSPVQFMLRYEERIKRYQAVQAEASNPARRKRAYRWSPWR